MNLIPVIRESLGLQENEEFNLINSNGVPFPERFRFTNDSLQIHPQEWEEAHGMTLKALLRGDLKVVKKPWRPKHYEDYYYVNVYCGRTNKTNYNKHFVPDVLRANSGNCYRTEEEAEKHVDEWMTKVYGKDWRELLK